MNNTSGLLARINYRFPPETLVSASDVFRYAEVLNYLLVNSKVFVIQDIDGDRGYALRMDAFCSGCHERDSINDFFVGVSRDIEILLNYFCYNTFQKQM